MCVQVKNIENCFFSIFHSFLSFLLLTIILSAQIKKSINEKFIEDFYGFCRHVHEKHATIHRVIGENEASYGL